MRRDPGTWAEYALIAAIVVAGAVFYAATARHVTAPGFPLDDSWIHLQFARNLATGHGFSYNPGTLSSGSTAPLWTLFLAAAIGLHVDPTIAPIVIGTLLTALTALLASQIARRLTGSRFAALLAGTAVALSPRMTWASVSGMELPLYCALTTATVLAYLRSRERQQPGFWWALLAGLTGTARPEAFLIFPILLADLLWQSRREGLVGAARGALLPCAAFCAVIAAYVGFNFVVGGHPLPNTFYAKNGSRGLLHAVMERDVAAIRTSILTEPVDALNTFLKWTIDQSLFLTLALLVGVLVSAGVLRMDGPATGGGIVLAAIVILTPMLKGALVPLPSVSTHNGRYVAHLLVLHFIVASVGLAYLAQQARRRWVVIAFAALALARLGSQDVKFAAQYAAQVKNINDLQVGTAAWIRQHTTPDAVIATNDIGAIAYFTGRSIIDMEGLVTPAIIPYNRRGDLVPYLEETRPDLIVMFPEWYPTLSVRTDLLHEVDRVTVRPVVIAGGETLVIYRTPWTRAGRVKGIEMVGLDMPR